MEGNGHDFRRVVQHPWIGETPNPEIQGEHKEGPHSSEDIVDDVRRSRATGSYVAPDCGHGCSGCRPDIRSYNHCRRLRKIQNPCIQGGQRGSHSRAGRLRHESQGNAHSDEKNAATEIASAPIAEIDPLASAADSRLQQIDAEKYEGEAGERFTRAA